MKKRIIVTGVDRSGTSCLARVLDCLGVPMQSPGEKAHFNETMNPTGYYEEPQVNEWLRAEQWPELRRYVEARYAAPLWGIKDPRLCVLSRMEPFLNCFRHDEDIRIVVTQRAAVNILKSWDRCGKEGASMKAVFDIQEELDATLAAVGCVNPVIVDYDALVIDPGSMIHHINTKLGLFASNTQKQRAIDSVDPKLRHFV